MSVQAAVKVLETASNGMKVANSDTSGVAPRSKPC